VRLSFASVLGGGLRHFVLGRLLFVSKLNHRTVAQLHLKFSASKDADAFVIGARLYEVLNVSSSIFPVRQQAELAAIHTVRV